MSDEQVIFNVVIGRPKDVVSQVIRKISAYTRSDRADYFKIGISNNPERRFKEEHSKKGYEKIIAVYQSSSINSVCELERELIRHNRDWADNIIGGGGGKQGEPPYYLYVVIL